MELSEIILNRIKRDHRGKENAIKREDLLLCLNCGGYGDESYLMENLTDRQLRNIYCQLPVVTCDKGIFWPVKIEEVEEFRAYLRKKAIPLFERWQRVADVHYDGKQMALFEEEK